MPKDTADHDVELWSLVCSVVKASNETFTSTGNEVDWTSVVLPLLGKCIGSEKGDLSQVKFMYGDPVYIVVILTLLTDHSRFSQTVAISPASLIPTLRGRPLAFKKMDLAIGFSNTHQTLKGLYKP